MGKGQRIFQKLNIFLLLLLILLMGVSLVQGFLNGRMDLQTFLGTFFTPWVALLGILLICFKLVTKKTREYLKENPSKCCVLEGIAVGFAIVSVLVVGFCFREKISFSDKGWLLLEAGEYFSAGSLSGATKEIVDYISANPGQMLYGWLFLGITMLVSDVVLAGFILQMILLGLSLIVTYFFVKKISNAIAGFFSIYLVGGTLIWKKEVLWVDGKLFYLLLVLTAFLLLAHLFAKREKAQKFSVKELCILILAGVFLAFGTVCELRTIFLVIPCLLFIGFSGDKDRSEEQESILDSKGIRCLIFFFVYGIVTITIGLLLALTIQHTLRLSLPVDVAFWSGWITSPIDGLLGFFYKLEELCLGNNEVVYEYGFSLALTLMAFVQSVVLFFKAEKERIFPIYLLICLMIMELILSGQTGVGLVFVVMLCILGAGLSAGMYEALLSLQLKKENLEEETDSAMAVSRVVAEGPVEVKDYIEEKIIAEEVAAATESEQEVEPKAEEMDSAEILELKEKLVKMESMIVSQQMRISRMEEMMKEQRLLAKKRERRLRQELAVARNKGTSTSDRTKR